MLRNASKWFIKNFRGLNTYQEAENLTSDWFSDALNVLINAKGVPEVVRSPKRFHTPVAGVSNSVLSIADFNNPVEHRVLFDVNNTSGADVSTYIVEDDLTTTEVVSDQPDVPFNASFVIGRDRLYRISSEEFKQIIAATWDVYAIGVNNSPGFAPVISYTGSGADPDDAIAEGIQFSLAYMNSITGHVGYPTPVSNRLGASGDSTKIAISVDAGLFPGVDRIVLFATLDGGDIPYLVITSGGDPYTVANSTATVEINISDILYDTLTPEPDFNYPAPAGAKFAFTWKDRVFLLGFDGSETPMNAIIYSGLESCYIGNPSESYPPLNGIYLPNRAEQAIGGVATQLGALILSEVDAYLLSGFPTDKTSGPEASTTVSEHLEPLTWGLGTKSPRTVVNTPFGTMWLDQNLRVQRWTGSGTPDEIGFPLRTEMAEIDVDSLPAVEAKWYQYGKNGGFYAIVADRVYIISIYRNPESGDEQVGYGLSDVVTEAIQPVWVNGVLKLFIGGTAEILTFLNPDEEGQGWDGNELFFELIVGNDENFTYWHSIRVDTDATSADSLTVTVKDLSGDNETPIVLEKEDDNSYFGLIDAYGRRKVLRFEFDSSRDLKRSIKNIQIYSQVKRRNF